MRDVITIGSLAEAGERRARLIDYVWKGSGLPAGLPQTDIDVEPPELASLVRGRIDRLTVHLPHGLTSTSHLVWPAGRHNGWFVLYHGGHGDPHGEQYGPATRRSVQSLLDNGFLVAVVDLPLHGWNRDERFSGHADFAAYESSEFSALTFFLEPPARILNQVERDHRPASIGLIGFSGGAWATTVYAAIDPRVRSSYPVAGSWPFFLRSQPAHNPNFGDWEQRADTLPGFYAIAGYLDLYVLGAIGHGRRQLQVLNRYDPSCFPGLGDQYAPDVERHVRDLGQGSWALLDDATHREHTVSPYAMSVILDDLQVHQDAIRTTNAQE
ncbi:alpha/beta hydrolase [Flindersiella endophytica]